MRRISALALLLVLPLASCHHQARLDGASLFSLHESTGAMKRELKLSKADAAALDGAIDVLVGDATRDMLAANEASGDETSPEARQEVEARVLAPVDDLTFGQVITAAADQTNRELEGLLAELSEYETIAGEHRKHLDQIAVVRAGYGMSLVTRRSWIDLTVRNGTEQTLNELLFDCRLLETGSLVREQGTCPAVFPGGLAPGATAIAQSYVGWESEPRRTRTVEARPIRAYGSHRAVLWQVPSEVDPRETGAIGELKNRVAVIDSSLRRLKGVEIPAED